MKLKVAVAVAVGLLLVGIAVVWAATRPAPETTPAVALDLAEPGILVRDTATGRLAVLAPDASRSQGGLTCARAYAAGRQAVCLHRIGGLASGFKVSVLDADLTEVRSFGVPGVPTRARVSASGRLIAWTTFVSGDSYLTTGFSTRTGIYDLQTGALITSLEDFTLEGKPPPVDANFWGVSFAADDETFYATMSTGGHFYLVRGSLAQRTVTILDDEVECPSLSPDGERLVFKYRLPDLSWQLWTLDLATMQRTQLTEPDSVDDQAAWLDDNTVMYAKLDENSGKLSLWSVPADGTGAPTKLADDAESPAVLPGP